jgi:hypothetical protein
MTWISARGSWTSVTRRAGMGQCEQSHESPVCSATAVGLLLSQSREPPEMPCLPPSLTSDAIAQLSRSVPPLRKQVVPYVANRWSHTWQTPANKLNCRVVPYMANTRSHACGQISIWVVPCSWQTTLCFAPLCRSCGHNLVTKGSTL